MTSESRFSFKGLLGRLLGKSDGVSLSHPSDLVNWNDTGDTAVTPDTVMRISTVYACDRIIKESIASSPLRVYKQEKQAGGKTKLVELEDHPLSVLLNTEPAPGMPAFMWKELLQHWLNMRGNAYCFKVESRRRIVALIPMNPDRMQVRVLPDGTKAYKYYRLDGSTKEFRHEEVWHLMSASEDGKVGKSPIDYLRDSFDNAMSAAKYASRSMRNDGATGIVFTFQGKLKPETREAMKKDFDENQAGPTNAGKPLLMEEGGTASRLNLTMAQMQFIESRKYSRSEIASIFRVPAHMVGDLERATFSNIEHQSLEFVGYTMRPWARRWEGSLLIDPVAWYNEPGLTVKYDLDDLQVADRKSRYEAHSSAINAGWLNRNEVREQEGYNPEEGLNKFLEPTNMKKPGEAGGNPNDPNNRNPPDPNNPPAKE